MISATEIVTLVVIALLGHVMALFWYLAVRKRWRIAERTIYDLPIGAEQTQPGNEEFAACADPCRNPCGLPAARPVRRYELRFLSLFGRADHGMG